MNEAQKAKLWSDYARTKSSEIREQLILEYAPLVKLVAGRLSMYLGYNVEYEDLCSYGIFGLIDAIDKFDSMKDVKFETYASLRIRGSILDQIRKMDWIPRTIRQRQRQIDSIMKEIENTKGRPATDEEIAQGLGVSLDEYADMQSQMKVTGVVSLNEFMETGAEVPAEQSTQYRYETPEEVLDKTELKQKLAEALATLTEKEQTVVTLYYFEELTLKEIANVLEVSESRVSQLHSKALVKMKKVMGEYMGVFNA